MPAARVEKFIRAVRPSITLTVEDGRYHDAAKAAMDASTRERLGQARSMDVNGRVLVEGGAGSGKSWLVVDWARRAVQRGERTAVVCFNRPMADRLASMLRDSEVVVDTYHGLGMGLLEPFGFAAPENPGPDWWRKAVTKELRKRAHDIGTPFDTIIVDEAQDLRPKWLDSLRRLLDPSGSNRLLMAMDPAQAIYVDKWSDSSEFFRSTLDVNLRSSRQIGELCQRLGGPAHLQDNPAGAPPSALRATGAKELAKRVRTAVEQLLEQGVPATEIAVLTTNRAERDGLIASIGSDVSLARWEDRDAGDRAVRDHPSDQGTRVDGRRHRDTGRPGRRETAVRGGQPTAHGVDPRRPRQPRGAAGPVNQLTWAACACRSRCGSTRR